MSPSPDEATGALDAGEQLRTTGERVQSMIVVLQRRWRIALGVLALAVAGSLALTLIAVKQYDATAQILLQPTDAVSQTVTPGLIPSSADAQRDVDTNAGLITSQPVLDAVRSALHLRIGDKLLTAKITVTGQGNSNLVSITARDPSRAMAQRIATALVTSYRAYRARIAQAAVRDALAAGAAQLRVLERAGAPAAGAAAALRSRVVELQASVAVQTGGVQVVQPALLPTSPATPKPLRSAVIAVVVGMILALLAALVLERTDRRLLSDSDVEDAFGKPVVAVLPRPRVRADQQVEVYAELAARLGYLGGGGPGVLVVGSSGGGRGSAEVVARLAAQVAAMDRRVIVIEADLQGIAETSGPAEGRGGLCAVLQEQTSLVQALVEVHIVPDPRTGGRLTAEEAIAYHVLPAGGPVANPAALLGRGAMRAVLTSARQRSDTVIVQIGSAERAGESLLLVELSDTVLLIAELCRTTREDAAAVRRTLERFYGRVRGVVVLPPARRRAGLGQRGSRTTTRPAVTASRMPAAAEMAALPRRDSGELVFIPSRLTGPPAEEV